MYDFTVVSCTYDAEKDGTKIVWDSNIVNKSMYDIKDISVQFDLYDGSSLIRTTDYITWTNKIEHGKSFNTRRSFSVRGKVTNVDLSRWSATYASLWETYAIWFIVTIVIASILVIAYVIFMIVEEFELDDLWDFLSDHLWLLPCVFIPFLPSLIRFFVSGFASWVPLLIALGGIVAIVVVILFSHFVKFIGECISYNIYIPERKKVKRPNNPIYNLSKLKKGKNNKTNKTLWT